VEASQLLEKGTVTLNFELSTRKGTNTGGNGFKGLTERRQLLTFALKCRRPKPKR